MEGLLEALEDWGGAKAALSHAHEEAAADEEGEEDGGEAEFVYSLPGLPLLADVPLPSGIGGDADAEGASGGERGGQSLQQQREQQSREVADRNRQQLVASCGSLLKQAVNLSCCNAQVSRRG